MATTGDDKHLDGSLSIQVRTAIRVRLLMRGEPARDLAKQLGTSEHCLSRRMASHVRLTVDGVESIAAVLTIDRHEGP